MQTFLKSVNNFLDMKTFAKLIAYSSVIVALFGCSYTVNVVGAFSNSDEILTGTASGNISLKSGEFFIKGEKSLLTCEGISEAPYHTPSVLVCEGIRGRSFGSCSDGRTFKSEGIANSCGRTTNIGKDSFGNTFYMIMDANMTIEEMKKDLKKAPSGVQ